MRYPPITCIFGEGDGGEDSPHRRIGDVVHIKELEQRILPGGKVCSRVTITLEREHCRVAHSLTHCLRPLLQLFIFPKTFEFQTFLDGWR